MADKIAMIRDLDGEAEFQVFARAEQVEVKYDKKNDPYHSIHLKDETGTTWMKAFKSHNLSVRPGDIVRGKAKVNLYQGKKSLKAWGDDLAIAEGSAGALDAPPPQTGAMGPSGGGAPQQSARQGTMTDEDYLNWLSSMAEYIVGNIPEIGEDPQAVQAACATAWIASGRGELTLTLGRQAAPEQGQPNMQEVGERASRAGKQFESEPYDDLPDDDDIPFSITLIPMILPLLGGLVGLS